MFVGFTKMFRRPIFDKLIEASSCDKANCNENHMFLYEWCYEEYMKYVSLIMHFLANLFQKNLLEEKIIRWNYSRSNFFMENKTPKYCFSSLLTRIFGIFKYFPAACSVENAVYQTLFLKNVELPYKKLYIVVNQQTLRPPKL